MPQHYPKSTVAVHVWCQRCGKATLHRVDHGRRGPCLACIGKREEQMRAQGELLKKAAPVQLDLFLRP